MGGDVGGEEEEGGGGEVGRRHDGRKWGRVGDCPGQETKCVNVESRPYQIACPAY